MNPEHAPLMLWIEGSVALVFMTAFVCYSFFAFKAEHVEHHPARVRIGAARDDANKALAKLDAIEGRKATA